MTLTAQSPPFQTGDTAYQQQLTLMSSHAGIFSEFATGDAIFLEDAEWVASQGVSEIKSA